MKFREWVTGEATSRNVTVTAVLEEAAGKVEISLTTLKACYGGQRLNRYDKAKPLSEYTGGKVSVEDLCDE